VSKRLLEPLGRLHQSIAPTKCVAVLIPVLTAWCAGPRFMWRAGRRVEVFVTPEHAPGAEAEDFGEVRVVLIGADIKRQACDTHPRANDGGLRRTTSSDVFTLTTDTRVAAVI
jgi:hypothetical protein